MLELERILRNNEITFCETDEETNPIQYWFYWDVSNFAGIELDKILDVCYSLGMEEDDIDLIKNEDNPFNWAQWCLNIYGNNDYRIDFCVDTFDDQVWVEGVESNDFIVTNLKNIYRESMGDAPIEKIGVQHE